MDPIRRWWNGMWDWLDKYVIFQVLFVGGGGGMTSLIQSGAELPLAYWLPNGFVVAAVLWLLWDRFDLPTGIVEVEPYGGQGPMVNWKKASRKSMSEHVVSHVYVNAKDIFRRRSRVSRGKNQRFEHCFINGPLAIRAEDRSGQRGLRPFNKCTWRPGYHVEAIEDVDSDDSVVCTGVEFDSCEFNEITFRLYQSEIDAIDQERKSGKWVTPSTPHRSTERPHNDQQGH